MKDLEEHSFCVKFCFKLGKTFTKTFQMLQQAYGEDCLRRTQCHELYQRFKSGRTSIEDDPKSERPSMCFRNNAALHSSYLAAPLSYAYHQLSTHKTGAAWIHILGLHHQLVCLYIFRNEWFILLIKRNLWHFMCIDFPAVTTLWSCDTQD